MDAQVVFQVIVVDKLGVAVEADVRAFTCVLPHVDLEFVLSEKKKKWQNRMVSYRIFRQRVSM